MFDSWAELGLKQDLVPISKQDTITSTPNDAGVQPFEAKEKPDEGVVHKQLLQAIIRSLTKRKIGAFIGNTAYMDRGLELKHQVNQLTIDTNEEDDQVRMMGNIPIENSSGIITSTICFSKQDDTYTLVKAKCTCPIGNWGNCKHCAAVMLHALDKRVAMPSQQQPIKEAEPSSPLSTKRSYDASEEDNDSSSNESRKKANASVESSCESVSNQHVAFTITTCANRS